MKEYAILRINNRGVPFILETYDNIEVTKVKLYELIDDDEDRNKTYYVDNDFFDNKFAYGQNAQRYYRIVSREISKWEKFENVEEKQNAEHKILKYRHVHR